MFKYKSSSLRGKLETLKPGESFVLFSESYKGLMRQIGVLIFRKLVKGTYKMKKTYVVISKDDEMKIGVLVTRTS